ncbi:MAG: redoxin domain-containing protein [Clostridia bacterium]|nr:redoxin domain-containing protein [Clostridia bacterium]
MKRKVVSLLLIVTLLCTALALILMGCNDVKVDYTVTVLMPDETTPAAGVTVLWQQGGNTKGSAVTNESGVASTQLPSGSYAVVLDVEGFTYPSINMDANMTLVTLPLSYVKVEYSATVLDINGNPAKNVSVLWNKGTTVAGTAKTGEDGVAKCILNYGTYSVTVMADTLPEGNIFNGTVNTTAQTPTATINLTQGVAKAFQVTVLTEGGLKYPELPVAVYKNGEFALAGSTDEKGLFSFSLADDTYTVEVDELPAGYTAEGATVSADNRSGEIVMKSSVIMTAPASNKRYVVGDIINDFTFQTPEVDGARKSYSIAELLKTKNAVVINNWGTGCTFCVHEMPDMQKVYDKYKDKIELIALDNYRTNGVMDTEEQIAAYQAEKGYTFPMARDNDNFAALFGITAWPTTIIIDKYGAIARIEVGAITSESGWERLISKYASDDYVQDFEIGAEQSGSIMGEISKPDITVDADHYDKIAEAINNFPASDGSVTYFGDAATDTYWPFLLGTEEQISPDKQVLYASNGGNGGKAYSTAVLYATVNVKPGKVFTFEYYSSCEKNDILNILWDGRVTAAQISGEEDGWNICHVYTDLAEGEHTLAFVYAKDISEDKGKDNVFIRNVRFVDISTIDGEFNMLRPAAYGTIKEGDTEFPYYAEVELGEDGFYYVNRASLQNPSIAGNDDKPMLFANVLRPTAWSNTPLSAWVTARDEKTEQYIVDCKFTINGVTKDYREDLLSYMRHATASYVADCVPVDDEFRALLSALMARISGENSHNDEWLEVCYFYSHYGEGEPIGNPIIGVTEKTAIPIGEGRHTADLTRIMIPYPQQIFTFTPSVSGVYKFESFIPNSDASTYMAQIWVYDDKTITGRPLMECGVEYRTIDAKNEHNFIAYMYLEAGHKYYVTLSFQMQMSGTYDFSIEHMGESVDGILTPAADNAYTWTVDEDGNVTDMSDFYLESVKVKLDEDGYYHALNADGSMGDYIYLNVLYRDEIWGTLSMDRLVDMYVPVQDGEGNILETCDFKFFDFRKAVQYDDKTYLDENGEEYVITYYSIAELLPENGWDKDIYKDYTEYMRGKVNEAKAHTGREAGLVKVDEELVKVLNLYLKLIGDHIHNNNLPRTLDNEWLRFCWYYKHFGENNPV